MRDEWNYYAKQILGLGDDQPIPAGLYDYLEDINDKVRRAGGSFRSRQAVAIAIATYEMVIAQRTRCCLEADA